MTKKRALALIGTFLILSILFSIVEARYGSYGGYGFRNYYSNAASGIRNSVFNTYNGIANRYYGSGAYQSIYPYLSGMYNTYNNIFPTTSFSRSINPIQYYNLYLSGTSGSVSRQQTNVIPGLAAAQWAGISPVVGYSLSLVGPYGTTNFLASRGVLISADSPYGHYTFNTDPVAGQLISADGPFGHITYTQGGLGTLYADGPFGRSTIHYSGGSMWADTPAGRVDFQLDSMGRPISTTDPFGGVTYFNWGGTYIISSSSIQPPSSATTTAHPETTTTSTIPEETTTSTITTVTSTTFSVSTTTVPTTIQPTTTTIPETTTVIETTTTIPETTTSITTTSITTTSYSSTTSPTTIESTTTSLTITTTSG